MESEYFKYFKSEAENSNEVEIEEEQIPNEAESAADFLHKVGFSNLTQIHSEGKEISDCIVNTLLSQKQLTEKQSQTVKSRVRTLNKSLHNRQGRRKQRQDIRDISWNVETSSTGTRSRSATPDSLDSVEHLKDDLSSDEDHQLLSLPDRVIDASHVVVVHKPKLKSTSSEPLQSKKISRNDKGDVAHLGSENVVLKGYQPLNEYPSLPRPQRERSGSDPTTEVHLQPLKNHNNIEAFSVFSKNYLNSNENEALSFEGLIKQNSSSQKVEFCVDGEGVNIDDFSDIEYQYLKPFLYVELVAIFDQYKIPFVKRKASSKAKGGNVFGVNLSTLLMRDMTRPTDNCMVPEIFQTVINQLNTRCICEDGILRLAGQKQKLEILCNEIESKFFTNRQEIEETLRQATVHELTGILKKLLRDLPDPVFTMELFDMFYKTSLIPNLDDKKKALNLLVLLLPIEHRNTFKLLVQLFLNIVQNEQQNRMNLHNVAMITAPSLFPPRLLLPKDNNTNKVIKQLSKEELAKQVNDAAVCCCIMETILKSGVNLWLIPCSLAKQAKEAQKRAQDKKENNNKDKRIRFVKTKLVRSSTQYEPGPMNAPRMKKELLV